MGPRTEGQEIENKEKISLISNYHCTQFVMCGYMWEFLESKIFYFKFDVRSYLSSILRDQKTPKNEFHQILKGQM